MAYISAAKSIGVSSTTFTQSVPKATEFGEITLRLGLLRQSRSSKVIEFGTNRKLICDLRKILPVSGCQQMASVPFDSESGVSHFNALAAVTPANIAINDISLKTRFCGLTYISAAVSTGVSSTTFT